MYGYLSCSNYFHCTTLSLSRSSLLTFSSSLPFRLYPYSFSCFLSSFTFLVSEWHEWILCVCILKARNVLIPFTFTYILNYRFTIRLAFSISLSRHFVCSSFGIYMEHLYRNCAAQPSAGKCLYAQTCRNMNCISLYRNGKSFHFFYCIYNERKKIEKLTWFIRGFINVCIKHSVSHGMI